ncbi:MAG TPA: histidine kinase [Tissierellia bacterium]|nr:histidine kinase [Tissierellia bacterium]
MDNIILKIPKKIQYMSTIRLTTSALVNINQFNVDEIEDIKVIISEICTFFINNIENDTEGFEITYEIYTNKVVIKVVDLNEGTLPSIDTKNQMSLMIIDCLADNYNIDYKNKTITFEKINNRR